MPEVHGSAPRPERPPVLDPTLFDDDEPKRHSLPDVDDRGPTEMGDIPDALQPKSEREGKTETGERSKKSTPERVGFSERAKALYGSLSERGKKLAQEVYAEVPGSDALKNLPDRFRAWNSERLAEAARRELVNLNNRMQAGEKKLRGYEAATQRELTALQQAEENIRAQGYTLSETARNKVDENLEEYRIRAEAASKDARDAHERSKHVTEKMKGLAIKSGAARQRIESRFQQQQGVQVEAAEKLRSVDGEYNVKEEKLKKQIEALDKEYQELQVAKRGSKSKDFLRLVNDLMVDTSKKRADLEYFREKMSAERKLLQKRVVEVADTKDLINLSENDDDADVEDDEPTQVTPVSELPVSPEESAEQSDNEHTNPEIVLPADLSEAPAVAAKEKSAPEGRVTYRQIYEAWEKDPPIPGVRFDKSDFYADRVTSKEKMARSLGIIASELANKLPERQSLSSEELKALRNKDAEALTVFIDRMFPNEKTDAVPQPRSAWFQDAEGSAKPEQAEAEVEQKMPAADIIQKWNESAPIKNLSFKTKDLSKIAAFKEKGILRLSEKDAADFLEKVATGVRGKKLNLNEKKKVAQFVKEVYQG